MDATVLGMGLAPMGGAEEPVWVCRRGASGSCRGLSCFVSSALAAWQPRRGGRGGQVATLHLAIAHGASRMDAAPPPRKGSSFAPASLWPRSLGVRAPSRAVLKSMIAVSPLTVPSFLSPLRLSPLGEELTLQEGGRSATPPGVVLPGFFTVATLGLLLTARLPMVLLSVLSASPTTAPLRFHLGGPEGRAGVAAPCARTGLRPTDLGACSGPHVGTCRTSMVGSAARILAARVGGIVAAQVTTLLLMATRWLPPRTPQAPCATRPRLPARPSITVVDCCTAQAWASSQGGKVRRMRPQEMHEDEEAALIPCVEIMAEE